MRRWIIPAVVFVVVLAGLLALSWYTTDSQIRLCREGGYSWTWKCVPVYPVYPAT